MSFYEGNYFNNRDYYDYGIDYEVMSLQSKFNQQIYQLKFYRRRFSDSTQFGYLDFNDLSENEMKIISCFLENATIDDLDKILSKHRDDLKEEFPWLNEVESLEKDLENDGYFVHTIIASEYLKQLHIHNTMCFLNIYTILDEYLSDLIKAVGMYHNDFLTGIGVRISYKQLTTFENDTDLREFFIDSAMISDKNLSGAFNKLKFVLKYLKANNEKYLDDIKLFNEERNCVVHNGSLYNKKSIKNLGEKLIDELNITIGGKVTLNNEKIDSCILLTEDIIEFLTNKILKDFSDFEPLNLEDDSLQS
ncbi:hypothetical protein MOD78_02450 [Bacillus haynesii]|uniref:hypothetical protein n=1 Tax=Bacillus haynesii TaxID=1925021 RepID=UPI002280DBFC|nr:hypothetical protein [Bacillus haynesii]MCY8410628.1 hypothetical protein [Bacillus haynesii]MCY8432565.1 hypothetical protein [Bacillus haynesii]MCY8624470.1 hypothetical protein [Bacillus haynesii]MCY8737762.1 hypothetical protein [Bacillus haynesii]